MSAPQVALPDLTHSGGLRRRLMAAFVGLSTLVVIAAAIAVLSLWMNRQEHGRISRQSIPIATTALDLTRVAQGIVDTVPELVAADTVPAQTALTGQLESRVTRLDALLEEMRNYEVDPQSAASIERAASLFGGNIAAINRLVSARIATRTAFDDQLAVALGAIDAILGIIEETTADRREGLARALEADPTIIAQRLRLLHARAQARELALVLQSLRERDAAQGIEAATTALEAIRAVREDVPAADREALAGHLERLEEVVVGARSLSRQRSFELQLDAASAQALTENDDLAERFAGAVNRMIQAAKEDVALANQRADRVQLTAFWMLSLVVAATLLSSFLIVRYYVYRNILARLTALTSSMMAIAGGNLSARIPEPTRDELGAMAAALRVFRDTAVDVRDSNLREIQETRSRLYHAIENIQEGFALFDADDRLTLSNAQFGRLLLGEAGRARGGEGYDAIMERMVTCLALPREDGLAWGDVIHAHHAAPEGTQIIALSGERWIGATERRTDDGGTVMVVTDLTAIKRHENELDTLVAQLQKASAAKSSFIANVSHELRTPLTAVLGFAQIVQSRLENVLLPKIPADDPATVRAIGQVRDNIGIMIQEGQRLTKMINDILDLEKIEAGQMVWDIEPLDMGSVIRQAAAATNSLYSAKGLEFHVSIAPDLPPVAGDRDRLVQVVINLISNAVKFTARGHVACSAMPGDGPFVSVSVSDTGIGISPADQLEVFDKFRQVGDTLTEKPTGTGLGLPICREIVEHLGGTITVESMPGFGSTFTFQLPVARAGASAIEKDRRIHGSENRDRRG
ncbi:HAMP domain-containing protein [Halovulum dunhuangense]|uniref:histidine kinase n=1 Tax=Halovulum dunhuangense TaxID=1505036 RepID=A0A849L1J7_9RHOB|nr:ATP-binding protein [Halovulum dunhuangense]NNU80134.1 HAMP domain-containing protein [Halovulum dunhuangense]